MSNLSQPSPSEYYVYVDSETFVRHPQLGLTEGESLYSDYYGLNNEALWSELAALGEQLEGDKP